jgi:hypothetical protein
MYKKTKDICGHCHKTDSYFAVHNHELIGICWDQRCLYMLNLDIPCVNCFQDKFDVIDCGIQRKVSEEYYISDLLARHKFKAGTFTKGAIKK